MRKVRLDEHGRPHCRKCGSPYFFARGDEYAKSTKHLRCTRCGARQKHRPPNPVAV
jgi:DNA-directed RNA polymerase subunit RPC12/RpoP